MADFRALFIQFQDHLAPRLDVYEQALYLYIARHTIAVGQAEVTIGFKSARKKMAFGVGSAGTPPSEGTIYEKLRSLEAKGCIKVLSSERTGTRLRLIPPNEIPGVIPVAVSEAALSLDQMDFFDVGRRARVQEVAPHFVSDVVAMGQRFGRDRCRRRLLSA